MDINSLEFTEWLINLIDERAEIKFDEKITKVGLEQVGKVAVTGSGATVPIYIENSTTAVEIKNSYGLSLVEGQLVIIERPNFKNNNRRCIKRLV